MVTSKEQPRLLDTPKSEQEAPQSSAMLPRGIWVANATIWDFCPLEFIRAPNPMVFEPCSLCLFAVVAVRTWFTGSGGEEQ